MVEISGSCSAALVLMAMAGIVACACTVLCVGIYAGFKMGRKSLTNPKDEPASLGRNEDQGAKDFEDPDPWDQAMIQPEHRPGIVGSL